MDARKRKRLEAADWKVGTTAEFLDLDAAEAALVDLRVSLQALLRQRRTKSGVTQVALARALGSSQSRVAKMEAGDPGVSLELLLRALFVVGASRREVGRALSGGG